MSQSGRYFITDIKTGRKFCIEPIGNDRPADWGDADPVTKKMTGHYGEKYRGSIEEKDSIIIEENGFKNIIDLEPGVSPEDYIKKLIENGKEN